MADIPSTPSLEAEARRLAREDAVRRVAARADTVALAGDDVPSPCISVCRIDAHAGLCEGCFRTLDEISGWSRASPAAKRAVWQAIRLRMTAG
ncbi:hypothetical protein RD110_07405 [Rhodoferax koreense]|uniref:DUF1289 domain-containing protein n=1 Tax=Rhodoferax koreensis TaxID=1842727 RepID=A0A1P8JTF5_9BURK|nr:DUF1289 domain-containing protein [Rhodoferax koreense]APW37044.1 hypothetical protein RD110_07405 [Rhodoferax koreense]